MDVFAVSRGMDLVTECSRLSGFKGEAHEAADIASVPGVDASSVLGARGGYGYDEQQVRWHSSRRCRNGMKWHEMT